MISLLITLCICATVAGVCTLFSYRGLPTITIMHKAETTIIGEDVYVGEQQGSDDTEASTEVNLTEDIPEVTPLPDEELS